MRPKTDVRMKEVSRCLGKLPSDLCHITQRCALRPLITNVLVFCAATGALTKGYSHVYGIVNTAFKAGCVGKLRCPTIQFPEFLLPHTIHRPPWPVAR